MDHDMVYVGECTIQAQNKIWILLLSDGAFYMCHLDPIS